MFDDKGGFYFTDLGKGRARDVDRAGVYYALADGSSIREIVYGLDHLNGIVYVDRMRDLSTLTHLAEWNKYWLGIQEQDD